MRYSQWLALALVTGSLSACLVSFDGYQLVEGGADLGGSGGSGASGGQAGSNRGGSSSVGGAGLGGTSSNTGGVAGEGGVAIAGGAGLTASGGSGNEGGTGTAGASGAGQGGTAQGGAGGAAPQCPISLPGPLMLEIPTATGGFFCIDRTEITNAHYAAFLAAKPSTSGQSSACAFNSAFTPSTTDTCNPSPYDPVGKPRHPIACVDQCDAAAYCKWAGKRLCGRIGGTTNAAADFVDANKSQWFRACSRAGALKFPYGNVYAGDACIGGDHPSTTAQATPTPNCQGGYDGLFDMSGNVSEWEDSCQANGGASDKCLHRGGGILDFDNTLPSLLCNSSRFNDTSATPATAARSTTSRYIGFRCCLDP